VTNVVVIGAGITGISVAVGLRNQGANVLLVERDKESRERFRGEYLQPYAVKGLHELGLGSIFATTSSVQVEELNFRDLASSEVDGRPEILSEIVISYPKGSKAQVIPNRELVDELRKLARKKLGDQFQEGATLAPLNADSDDFYEKPRLLLTRADGTTETLSPDYIVGCDGRQSTVREWIKGPKAAPNGPPMLGAKPEFIVGCELKRSTSTPERYEVVRTHGNGTLSLFQLKSDRQRVYWNAPLEKGVSKAKWQSSLEKNLGAIREYIELDTIEIENVAGAPANTLWMGPAARGRFFLAGDALAVTTPLGGQGMTCSRHHVDSILELLDHRARTRGELELMGKRYEQITKKWYFHVNLLNLGLYYLFFANKPAFKISSKHILGVWNAHPEMKDRIGRLFGGDDLDTPGLLEILRLWGLTGPLGEKIRQLKLLKGYSI